MKGLEIMTICMGIIFILFMNVIFPCNPNNLRGHVYFFSFYMNMEHNVHNVHNVSKVYRVYIVQKKTSCQKMSSDKYDSLTYNLNIAGNVSADV